MPEITRQVGSLSWYACQSCNNYDPREPNECTKGFDPEILGNCVYCKNHTPSFATLAGILTDELEKKP